MAEIETAFEKAKELTHVMSLDDKKEFLKELVERGYVTDIRLLELKGYSQEIIEKNVVIPAFNYMIYRYESLPSSFLCEKLKQLREE